MALCAFLMRPEPPTLCNPLHIVHVHIYFRCQVTVAPYLHDPRQIRPIAFGTRQVELHSIPMKRVCKYPLVPANLQLESDLPLDAAVWRVPESHPIPFPPLPGSLPRGFPRLIPGVPRPDHLYVNTRLRPHRLVQLEIEEVVSTSKSA